MITTECPVTDSCIVSRHYRELNVNESHTYYAVRSSPDPLLDLPSKRVCSSPPHLFKIFYSEQKLVCRVALNETQGPFAKYFIKFCIAFSGKDRTCRSRVACYFAEQHPLRIFFLRKIESKREQFSAFLIILFSFYNHLF